MPPFDPYLRMQGLFDPYRPIPRDTGLGNMPTSPNLPGLGIIKQGSVLQAPQISMPAPVTLPETGPVVEEGPDYLGEIERIFNLYKPSTKYGDRLSGLLDTMPQRQEPGFLRRIGGMMAGIGYGPEQQEQHMYQPYLRQMADWKAKYDPTLQAANLERAENVNERTALFQAGTQAYRDRMENRRYEDMQNDYRIAQERNKIAADRNWDLVDAGGYIWRVNVVTGERENTGIQSRFLTAAQQMEIQRLNRENALARSRISAANSSMPPTVYNYDDPQRPRAGVKVRLPSGEVVTIPLNEATPEQIAEYQRSQGRSAQPLQAPTPPAEVVSPPSARPESGVPIPTPRSELGPEFDPESELEPESDVTPNITSIQVKPEQLGQTGKPVVGRPTYSPTQQTEARLSVAEAYKNQMPGDARFITVDRRAGTITIVEPRTRLGRQDPSTPTWAQWRRINQSIYGTSEPPPPPGAKPGGVWVQVPSGVAYKEPE